MSTTLLSDNSIATGLPIGLAHPVYQTWAPIWRKLSHVYEGSGGFLDGGYLIPHPREWQDHSSPIYDDDGKTIKGWQANPNPTKPTEKLKERRRLARYENIAATIIDQKVSALFREPPVRKVKGEDPNHPWLQWCANVDGRRTSLTDWMKACEIVSLVFGHSVLVMDKPKLANQPRTQAEVPAPFLRAYTPLDVPDWLTDEAGAVTALKLLEAIPRTSLDSPALANQWRTRHLDGETWKIVDERTSSTSKVRRSVVDQGRHMMGRLPATLLYAKRRTLIPVIGASVLHDPQLFVDQYNMTSELRELFRKQAFSLLNVPLGAGDNKITEEEAKRLLGEAVGTMNVIFSGLPVQYVSPDQGNVTSYQTELARLLRTIFRLCSVPWESDSKDAESEGSMKLKREDMNQILSGYASELEMAELDLAELWFRAMHGTQNWEREWDKAEPSIRYDKTFDVTPFEDMLEQAQAALALPLGQSKTFLFELASAVLNLFLPKLSETARSEILAELKKLPDPIEAKQTQLNRLATAFGGAQNASGAREAAEQLVGEDEPEPEVVAA